jgi:hypothetical protein
MYIIKFMPCLLLDHVTNPIKQCLDTRARLFLINMLLKDDLRSILLQFKTKQCIHDDQVMLLDIMQMHILPFSFVRHTRRII